MSGEIEEKTDEQRVLDALKVVDFIQLIATIPVVILILFIVLR